MAWLRYQSQNQSPSQRQEHGRLLPLERRVPLGHASVPLLEYALMALLSTYIYMHGGVPYMESSKWMSIMENPKITRIMDYLESYPYF